jgi:hypothetical protein
LPAQIRAENQQRQTRPRIGSSSEAEELQAEDLSPDSLQSEARMQGPMAGRTTRGDTGTGLGLWVTGEILRRNGWKMQVRTRCGPLRSGTAFSIVMPAVNVTAVHEGVRVAVA